MRERFGFALIFGAVLVTLIFGASWAGLLRGRQPVLVSSPSPRANPTAQAGPRPTDCAPTPVQTAPWPGDISGLASVPWVQADPVSAGVVGHLYYGNRPMATNGEFPDGAATKILWTIHNPDAGEDSELSGVNLTGAGTYHQIFAAASSGHRISRLQVPSLLELPRPGCWELTVTSGEVVARIRIAVE